MAERTVAAISTPKGEGGIAVIRISGEDAFHIADKCFKGVSEKSVLTLKGYEAMYGAVYSGDEKIDDAVLLAFRAPKSYTGENVVEISVHAGTAVALKALRAVLDCGAYPAQNGEFTKRAFLNGKLDLAEAESVMELISAKGNAALKIASAAKEGRVSREIEEIIALLLETAASISAYSDYPDEEIEGLNQENFTRLLENCENRLSKLLKDFDSTKAIREGIDCAIVGKPNVGKSTLMNMLSGFERSIVTDIAGTTRDIIESTVSIGDITLNLADTAGIRETEDIVENAGVRLAEKRLQTASVVLAVFDSSSPLTNEDSLLLEKLDKSRSIIVLNKTDLGNLLNKDNFKEFLVVEISAKNLEGIEELKEALIKLTRTAHLDEGDVYLVNERQYNCVLRAQNAIAEALNTLNEGFTMDAVGVCVDDAVAALLELTGKRVANEVCDEIFRRFCVGK